MRNVHCRSKHCKGIGEYAYTYFFFARLLNIKTRQRYIDIILLEIFRPSGANIHINKCYFAKSYSAKCKNSKYFGGSVYV